jgi:hypothetical protein
MLWFLSFHKQTMHIFIHNTIAMISPKKHTLARFEPGSAISVAAAMSTVPSRLGRLSYWFSFVFCGQHKEAIVCNGHQVIIITYLWCIIYARFDHCPRNLKQVRTLKLSRDLLLQVKAFMSGWMAGLPDFSWNNLPKHEEIYQINTKCMVIKYTKCP